MTRRARLSVSSATIVLFFASFLTHDAGALLHSLVSLVFTFVLFFHLRSNWRVYVLSARNLTRKIKWRGLLDTGAPNSTVAGGVFSIIGGLTGSPGETGFYSALAAVHFWLAAVH